MERAQPWTVDKTGWAEGPWMHEPDKVNWRTQAGLPGMIVRNDMGALCGYAAVGKEHPLYGVSCWDITGLASHGRVNYSNHCGDVICHVPEPGEPADVWWFGFDCAHVEVDFVPGMDASFKAIGYVSPFDGCVYRDVAYVTKVVEVLAHQLVHGPYNVHGQRA